ncbi:MAG TPA: hypothetical protein PK441_05115 [Burkholderiaceae bacterium]|nr:hypothetical protein [Burkholderiaceae bacterium]HOS86313.1 hypothetical protein [Burkholderiaceae bacterium]HPL78189.1 hypothetical protein [Burkholderiaceae bacterium]
MTQIAIPVDVAPHEVQRKVTLGGAIELCAEVGGKEPKAILSDLKLDKAQWSRWISGHEGVCWPKLSAVMDLCGNDAPLQWMVNDRGYDLHSLRSLESETERQNRMLREENAALRRVLMAGAR